MANGKMHDDEVEIDDELVRKLVATQFPHLRELAVRAVQSKGTVNAIYRLGDDMCVRLPRHQRWADDLGKELRWLGRLGSQLPLAVPEPVGGGDPGSGYPFGWAVYRWLEGDTYRRDLVDDERQAAFDLANFVSALRRIDVSGAPRSGRLPLHQLDDLTRAAIGSLDDRLNADLVTDAWERSLHVPAWNGSAIWRHCDLLPANLLVKGGRLHAIIDFGGVGIGDPAADVIAAWTLFGVTGRASFRDALDVDEDTWIRARGYALHQALLIIPYYCETNPAFAATAMDTVAEVLTDLEA
jgi:aminoglycoside phosphotransferase (APT) family kinase protein